jgi:putative hydrolase of the HAD superfamily
VIRAVLWDFGGVILSSPFDAFARYESELKLPEGFIRRLNATNPDTNAWSRLERGEVSIAGFAELFEAEATAAGGSLDGQRVVTMLSGEIRPEMVDALRTLRERYVIACLTNNFAAPRPAPPERQAALDEVMGLFHHVVESSKVGVRKPEPEFFEHALAMVDVPAEECVFLDDLGINLKPARALGMTTIKVESAPQALADLEDVLGHPVS